MNRLAKILLLAVFIPSSSIGGGPITHVYQAKGIYCACVTVPNLPGVTESLKLTADVTYCSISGMLSPNDVGLGERIIRSTKLPARMVAEITSQKLCNHLFLLVPL